MTDGPRVTFALVPEGTAVDDDFWVRRLCLASISLEGSTVYGANVTQKGLGDPAEVLGILLSEAMGDIKGGATPVGVARLDGLCKWISDGIRKGDNALLEELREDEKGYGAVEAIATDTPRAGHSVVGFGTFRDGKEGWEKLARDFAVKELNTETKLFGSKGILNTIEHLADDSPEYIKSAGGAIATYSLK